nr:hypothetical protein [Tanacetum cinerariifolium]
MGEPLSPYRVFDFPEDELEPHPAYDFFSPAPLPGYAGNPNNNNGCLAADDYVLGELEAMVDEQMVIPAIEEVTELVAEADEEQVIALVVDMEEGQMDVLMIDMGEDLAMLYGENDEFENDYEGVDEEEAWEVNEEWLMAPVTPPLVPAVQPPSIYEVGGFEYPSGNLEYGHGQLVQRVNQVSDAEVAAGVTIGELGPRIYVVERQVYVMASQMVHAADRWEQIDVRQRDTQIQQLQTTVTKMGSRESTLMRCILGLERRIAALEKISPGPR